MRPLSCNRSDHPVGYKVQYYPGCRIDELATVKDEMIIAGFLHNLLVKWAVMWLLWLRKIRYGARST